MAAGFHVALRCVRAARWVGWWGPLFRGSAAKPTTGRLPGPVNIGHPDEVSMGELAREVIALTGSHSPIVHLPLPEGRVGDPARRRPDISRARDLLGWEPKVTRDEGLARTVAALREQLATRAR